MNFDCNILERFILEKHRQERRTRYENIRLVTILRMPNCISCQMCDIVFAKCATCICIFRHFCY